LGACLEVGAPGLHDLAGRTYQLAGGSIKNKIIGAEVFAPSRCALAVSRFLSVLLHVCESRIPQAKPVVRYLSLHSSFQKLPHTVFTVKATVSGEHHLFEHIGLLFQSIKTVLHRFHDRFQVLASWPSPNACASTIPWCFSSTVAIPLYPWITPWLLGILALSLSVMLLLIGLP